VRLTVRSNGSDRQGPSGTTQVAAVIGSPVRHSLSPAIHNAAFVALGLDWVYVAFQVGEGDGGPALEAMRTFGLAGLSVTMPLKEPVAAAVDVLDADAAALRSVNCVSRVGGELIGHSTDGPGFIDCLRDEAGVDPTGRRVLVLGAGGAARAVVRAVAAAGATEVVVVNRHSERGRAAATLAGPVGRLGTLDDLAGAELIVNATPVGMGAGPGAAAMPVPQGRLDAIGSGHVVVDLVYQPLVTSLMRAASEREAMVIGGLGMLVHQAAHAFRLWTGREPPLEVMRAAAGLPATTPPSSVAQRPGDRES